MGMSSYTKCYRYQNYGLFMMEYTLVHTSPIFLLYLVIFCGDDLKTVYSSEH